MWIDVDYFDDLAVEVVCESSSGIFKPNGNGGVQIAIEMDDLAKKDSELIACEIECLRAGRPVLFVELEIPGLELIQAGRLEPVGEC